MATLKSVIDNYQKTLHIYYKYLYTEDTQGIEKDLLVEIGKIEYILNTLCSNPEIKIPKMIEIYNHTKEHFNKIKFAWDPYFDFYTIANFDDEMKFSNKTRTFSNKDLLELTHDFYKQLDQEFFKYFNKLYKIKDKRVSFIPFNEGENYGETRIVTKANAPYINVKKLATYQDVFSTVHEFSHGISSLMNPRHITPEKMLFTEIDSTFMELIAADYFSKILDNEKIQTYKAEKHHFYSEIAERFVSYLKLIILEDLLKEGYTNKKRLKSFAIGYCNLNKDSFNDLIYGGYESYDKYLLDYMFAVELYTLYKLDKDAALYYLKRIINLKRPTSEKYFEDILKLGIIPNANMLEYHEEIKNYLNDFSRIRK